MTESDLARLAPSVPARVSVPSSVVPSSGDGVLRTVGALVAWCALVVIGHVVVVVTSPGVDPARLDAAPLHATLDPVLGLWVVVPVALVIAVALVGPSLAQRLSWRRLLVVSWLGAAAWSVALAGGRGWDRLTAVFERPGEYLAVLPRIESVGTFLGHYVADIRSYPVHVQGHPPGFVLVSWALEQVSGIHGGLLPSVLSIVVGAAAVPAVMVTVRAVADEGSARRAAPFLVVAPFALSVATSADALYAGVGAWAVACVVLATGRRDARGDLLAVAGGLLFGCCALLSYGLVLLAVIPLVVAVQRRRARPVLLAMLGAVPVFLVFLAAGFWWVDGLLATRRQYFVGIASRRAYEVYVVANLASFAILLGPAIAVAFVRLRDRRLWLVVGGALAAVALADLSGMSKSEVERIWLPFAPFILAATAALTGPAGPEARAGQSLRTGASTVGRAWRAPRTVAGWIALQAGFAIVLEAAVRTGW